MENNQFQLNNGTGAVRYKGDEITSINALITEFGEIENTTFTSFKDLFSICLQSAITANKRLFELQQIEQTTENAENIAQTDELKAVIANAIEVVGYENTPTLDVLITDLVQIANTPLEPAPVVEIEKETIKEVFKPLEPNQLLLELSPAQLDILQKINRWRSFKRISDATENIESTVKKMLFNVGTLTNDHGYFQTGITADKLKTKG